MAVCYPPPPRFVCIKCGGQIPPKNINEPTDHHPNCRCINCIMIGPGRQPTYVPDKEKHTCQKPIDKEAIAAEKRRLEKKFPLKLGDPHSTQAAEKYKR